MSDYEHYLRTGELLSLQKAPAEMAHRDELLFQTVHQASELWLNLAGYETEAAAASVRAGDVAEAGRLLGRATQCLRLLTPQLDLLESLSPWDYRLIRRTLGGGSGFDSPGFGRIQRGAKEVGQAFDDRLAGGGIALVDVYRRRARHAELFALAEGLVDWDERVGLWRLRHLKLVERLVGPDAVGTQGTPIALLRELACERFFPKLWELRTEITRLARDEARDDDGSGPAG